MRICTHLFKLLKLIEMRKNMESRETIAAIATGMGNAGIGIVRISGDDAVAVADRVFKGKNNKKLTNSRSHMAHYGHIYDGEELIDEALVLVMKAPNTYTREDVVEIDCHGGAYVTRRILELVLKNGARAAEPGEFTKRAFLNGRIDLAQAEAVIDVINAKNNYALKSSVSMLNGKLSTEIKKIREELIYNIAFIEAALDDPEHISLDNFVDKLDNFVDKWINAVDKLLTSVDNGKIFTEGVRTVILGKPNAGKSSLLNTLLGEERAIVTDIAGTTRDTLEEQINVHGIILKLIDTAGIRQTEDIVEKLGVDKSRRFAKDADLIIYVVDSSTELDDNDMDIISMINEGVAGKVIVLLNKSDLAARTTENDIKSYIDCPVINISAKEQEGIDELEKKLEEMFLGGELSYNDEIMITRARQKDALRRAKESLELVKDGIAMAVPEDLLTIDLMNGYEELGKIIGESVEEDLVNEIFSKFCMGK